MNDGVVEADQNGSVDAETLAESIRRGEAVTVLDVRDREDFESWHVDGAGVDATQIPYNRLLAARARDDLRELLLETVGYRPPVVVIVVCAKGHSSSEIASDLREAGVDAVNLEGGMEAWADVYTAHSVDGYDGHGTLLQYHRPATGCLAYLLVVDGEAAVFDPVRGFADRYVDDAANLDAEVTTAVDTHVHADHLSGVREVAERTGAARMMPAGARDRGLAFDAETIESGPIPDGTPAFTLGNVTVRAVSVPGHTSEMTAFRVGSVVLTGDSLLLSSVARPDLEAPERARERAGTLYDSVHRLVDEFPAHTVVAPGHANPSDSGNGGALVADLSQVHGRLDLLDLDRATFVERIASDLPPRPANHERIVATNLGQEQLDEETARTVALGPNNCAATV